MESAYYIISLCIAALLGFIPAKIASDKGYSFVLWWFFGFMLFIVAIIAVVILPDKNVQEQNNAPSQYARSSADELMKYKELLDKGVITQEEFEAKKSQILNLK